MKVGEYCTRDVVVINSDESVKTAAELMRFQHVGDLVLLEKRHSKTVPIGIITDRDLVVEVMAVGLSPDSLLVRDILTQPLYHVFEEDDLFDALNLMHTEKIRRLPVVNQNHELVGIITIDDFVEILTEMMSKVTDVAKLQQKREARKRS